MYSFKGKKIFGEISGSSITRYYNKLATYKYTTNANRHSTSCIKHSNAHTSIINNTVYLLYLSIV